MNDVVIKTTLREANIARQQEWDPSDSIGISFRGNEMAGEVGELLEKAIVLLTMSSKIIGLCNLLKKLDREHLGLRGARVDMEAVSEEFGDAQICLDLCAMIIGVDLDQTTKDKFNAVSIKHGLKTRYQ